MISSANPFLSRAGRRGSVLIITMWVCLGLISVTLILAHTSYLNYRASDNGLAARQADLITDGALRYVEYVLANLVTPGAFPAATDYTSEAVPVGDGMFWLIGRGEDTDHGLTRTYGLVDEASKVNLNTATVEMLEALGLTPDFAAAIKEWHTTVEDDANATTAIAASDVKGAPFESEAELALLDGADPVLLAGEDANLNGVLDEDENDGSKNDPPDNSDGKLDPGILEYVTVFSREPKTRADGSDRFVVSPRVTPETLAAIKVAYPSVNLGTADPVQTYASPLDFYVKTGMSAADFDQICGDLTGGKYQGLINVNSARETVLRCIPGLENKAADLVAARLARTPGDGALSWVKDVLDADTVTAVGQYLTGRSYQVTADIAAVGRNGRGYRRTRFVVDTLTGTPRVIYRRNLSGLGWALGSDARALLENPSSQTVSSR